MMRALALVLVLTCFAGGPAIAQADGAEPLLIALSKERIEVDSRFSGTTIALVGATRAPGDVIVTVRGPERATVVRRKRRAAGIWVNRDSVAFRNVPEYYAVAASRPLEEIAPPALLQHHQAGIDNLRLEAIWIRAAGETDAFRAALARDRMQSGLYAEGVGTVEFVEDTLFRVALAFPAAIPTGEYIAEALLVRDGSLVAKRHAVFTIEKGGFAADVSHFSREDAPIYGAIAILVALVAGWIGSYVFRRT